MTKAVYEIDGRDFATLEEFYKVVSRVLSPGPSGGARQLCTPEGGFILLWKNSALSREQLGYTETVRQLDRRLTHCHPSNRQLVGEDLERARLGVGPTVFDWLVEIIEVHCTGGAEQEDGVELVLD